MPAEIINRLESLILEIETSVANNKIDSSTKTHPLDPLESEMRAMKFIWNLPIIDLDFLNEDEQCCSLCGSQYEKEFKVCQRGESPSCLPCGHIAGHQCIRAFLSPYEGGFTRCPFCKVDFPQMFTDPAEPAQPTSDLAWEDVEDHETSDEELSRQVLQLSKDSGAPSQEVRRYLSIEDVLERSRSQAEGTNMGTAVHDFATRASGPEEIGGDEFPTKHRRNGASPTLAHAAMKAVNSITMKF